MLTLDVYPTTRVEVWLRLILLSAVPILVAVLGTLAVRAETLVLSVLFAAVALGLLAIALLSFRLWNSVSKAARARASEMGAELICPVAKFTLVDADGSVRHGGKGWCLVTDDAILIEEVVSRDQHLADTRGRIAKINIRNVGVASSGWAVARIKVQGESSQMTFEVMRESGSPYLTASRATLLDVAERLDALSG